VTTWWLDRVPATAAIDAGAGAAGCVAEATFFVTRKPISRLSALPSGCYHWLWSSDIAGLSVVREGGGPSP
jgi:hypothetical protein